jgi:uncharacterized protein YdiU (UPF0061 family)
MMISEAVAISTRVAPSFIRIGQLELFARRTRKNEHPKAMEELEKLVLHLIGREYADIIDKQLTMPEKVVLLAREFRSRFTSLVANWIRVGFCQGNFNSDNCAVGGFTLDYGPFGFCDVFNPHYQPWTGGGRHFSFMNQPNAAQRNFEMFCSALRPLLASDQDYLIALDEIQNDFSTEMHAQMEKVWAAKLGLSTFNTASHKARYEVVLNELGTLMTQTPVDYTIFFRELSSIPNDISPLKKSFYSNSAHDTDPKEMDKRWSEWLTKWTELLNEDAPSLRSNEEISKQMKLVNPKYSLREWFLVPAYQQATAGDYSLIRELQDVMTQPYVEQSKNVEDKYYKLKPPEFFEVGGLSHLSCSS